MRLFCSCLLMIVMCLGCDRAEKARRDAAEENLRQVRKALEEHTKNGDDANGAVGAVDTEDTVEPEDAIKRQDDALDVSDVVKGGNQFALELYQQLRQLRGEEGSLFYSPTSVSTALAMTYAGAAGGTEAEMAKTLRFDSQDAHLHDRMRALQELWNAPDKKKGIRLNLANRLWGSERSEFLPDFLQVTRDQYGAELERLDFSQTEDARNKINIWVADQTENKITDVISADALSSDTKLVLTNAVYFHGVWADPFKKDHTEEADFHRNTMDKVQVPLMYRQDGFRYAATDELQILTLPYGDGGLSMVVLLPQKVEGLAALESKLTYENLQRWLGGLRYEDDVKVYLPRFKTTSLFEMSGALQALGMTSAFDDATADFSKMTGGKDLFLSKVIHKAFVDVNEEGTEAAAATAVVADPTSAPVEEPKQPLVFRADHPFVFLIQDNRNKAILFVGRVTNPLE